VEFQRTHTILPGKCENKWQELLLADDAKNRAAGRLVKKDPTSAERAAEIADKIRDERKSEIKMLLAKIVAEAAQVCFTTVVLYVSDARLCQLVDNTLHGAQGQ
jgi:hypothetical protein